MRVLLVEDAEDLAEATQRRLARSGMACDWVTTLEQARACLDVQGYDALILDINLPDGSGTDLLRQMRRAGSATPVVMLTAQFSVDDKLSAFALGADDYLIKPFDHRELEARLHAILRREKADRSPELVIGALSYNPTSGLVQLAGQPLELARREFALLGLLMRNRGQVLSKKRLLEGLYGFDDTVAGENAIELYVARLRKRLSGSGVEIQTLRGRGYRLDATNEVAKDA
ncbi:two-component system response regulator TctD [Rhodobacter aestuarii]|uniref:Two-component system, OmpR family, response regulator TctD n=1 Tax=Rhodobacter aestuarii TaxID=453582 RepID=A0A1N7MRC9_9RHOB|nr:MULTISPECIES: response regulator transcription factor [Rhodobacter]PTV96587.1 two-component system response regulator TctD [Rhodobacter aestuarii]SIS88686.1 two-component system, OmpR family, response regulator TctD [Rhodobacter aestuarii]SOB91379.1 two-component system response regulator TctD [Rhodobacter sp. JA431]